MSAFPRKWDRCLWGYGQPLALSLTHLRSWGVLPYLCDSGSHSENAGMCEVWDGKTPLEAGCLLWTGLVCGSLLCRCGGHTALQKLPPDGGSRIPGSLTPAPGTFTDVSTSGLSDLHWQPPDMLSLSCPSQSQEAQVML